MMFCYEYTVLESHIALNDTNSNDAKLVIYASSMMSDKHES